DITVTIKGDNPHTKASTILNRVDMRPGDIADIRKFRESERRIKLSGLFNVDPTKGELPSISFSPPESTENVARGKGGNGRKPTGNTNSFRGQSPDGPPARPILVPAPRTEYTTRWVNGQPAPAQPVQAPPT